MEDQILNSGSCAIFFHNYYGEHQKWVRYLADNITIPYTLFYNIVEDSIYNLQAPPGTFADLAAGLQQIAAGSAQQKLVLRTSPNQGKDIGGKLVLLDACLRLNQAPPAYSLFLHDKRSPHKPTGDKWGKALLSIAEPAFARQALATLEDNPQLGIIARHSSLRDEFDHQRKVLGSTSRPHLERLLRQFDIKPTGYTYVAGTMFWAKTAPFLDFFRNHSPLDIRKTLEKGNVLDENAGSESHAWERMFSWLIFASGYTLKGQ